MMRITIAVLTAAFTLLQPALSIAADKSTGSRAKPTSFVPHSRSNTHVYGSPIQPAIVGHAKTSHPRHVPNRKSESATHRTAR
jgi:hypothetical protein